MLFILKYIAAWYELVVDDISQKTWSSLLSWCMSSNVLKVQVLGGRSRVEGVIGGKKGTSVIF